MAEKSITCDTFDRLELPPGPAIRISPDVNSSSGIPVMGSCRHWKDFFGRYASSVCSDKVYCPDLDRTLIRQALFAAEVVMGFPESDYVRIKNEAPSVAVYSYGHAVFRYSGYSHACPGQ